MEIVDIKDTKNNIVVKHKELIWSARYRLSELGIKVIAVLISMIQMNDDDFQQYILKIDDFKELIGSDSKNTYKYTHNLIKELLSKTLKVGDEQFAWISYGKYIEGSNTITFEINRHLKPYLLALKGNFLKYNIRNILPLKSAYVIRLYELLKSKWSEYKHYNSEAKSFTFELKIDWLREHFEIPNSYQYSSHIKKRIINKAQKEFREKTDIEFSYKEQKIGKKVDRLIITIKSNKKGYNRYLKNIKTFIYYIRRYFANENILEAIDYKTNKKILLSVDENGYLYDKYNPDIRFSSNRSKEMWNKLYKLAKKDKLEILNI